MLGRTVGLAGLRRRPATRSCEARARSNRCARSASSSRSAPATAFYFEPGENHWHGATPSRFNTQIAYQETDDSGSHTSWGRHVTDEEYPG
jgi:hypothetical protein